MTLENLIQFLNDRANSSYRLVDPKPVYTRKEPIPFECSVHGRFTRNYNGLTNVKNGLICPKCSADARGETRDTAHLVEKIESKFGVGYFDLSRVEYKGYRNPVTVGCRVHGWFETLPDRITHATQRNDCPACAQNTRNKSSRLAVEEFITKAQTAHGDRYDYSTSSDFAGYKSKVTILCRTHGSFQIHAGNHLTKGRGCPKCARIRSSGERDLADWVAAQGVLTQLNYRDRLELDIFLPEQRIGIEYCGLYWHSEIRRDKNYHKDKREYFAKRGIRVIHVYEDEWRDNREVVARYLSYQIGHPLNRYFARKCSVIDVDKTIARNILKEYHLQGACSAQRYIGLRYESDVVAVGAFTRAGSNRGADHWELIRYVTKGCTVVGGLGKLMKAFYTEVQSPIYSYTDLDKFTGGGYAKAGFVQVSEVPPDYRTVWTTADGKIRRAKQYTRRSNLAKLNGFNFDPTKSEHQNCLDNGIYRAYDAGKIKWRWG